MISSCAEQKLSRCDLFCILTEYTDLGCIKGFFDNFENNFVDICLFTLVRFQYKLKYSYLTIIVIHHAKLFLARQ